MAWLQERGCRSAWRRRGRLNNPHAVRVGSNKLCHRVAEGRVRVDMEDRKESRPCSTPRSDRMTLIKCMHVFLSRGRLAAFVRCLTSAVEMLPATFKPLSTTATEVRPSLLISVRASARLESAL